MAFVLSNISLSHNARELMAVDPAAKHRSKPEDCHRLFADAAHMQQVIQVVRDRINTVVTVSRGTRSNRPLAN